MTFTPEETEKLKTMFTFIIKKKHVQSNGHSGFSLEDLKPILNQLEADGVIDLRPTINSRKYFLNLNNYK